MARGQKRYPKPNKKYGRWGHCRRNTVAQRSTARRGRKKKGRGRGSYLSGLPHLRTDKAATRNNGRAPYQEVGGKRI